MAKQCRMCKHLYIDHVFDDKNEDEIEVCCCEMNIAPTIPVYDNSYDCDKAILYEYGEKISDACKLLDKHNRTHNGRMTVYEYITSLPKDDMSLFLIYYCGNHCVCGISVDGWKSRFMYAIKNIFATYGSWILKEQIKTYDFLCKKFEGKEVYERIKEMTQEELSGMFGHLSISDRARLEVLMNGNPVHIIGNQAIGRTSTSLLKWMEREI